jgi:hypothetical protein
MHFVIYLLIVLVLFGLIAPERREQIMTLNRSWATTQPFERPDGHLEVSVTTQLPPDPPGLMNATPPPFIPMDYDTAPMYLDVARRSQWWAKSEVVQPIYFEDIAAGARS